MRKRSGNLDYLQDLTGLKESISALQGDRRNTADNLFAEILFMQGTLKSLKERIKADGAIIEGVNGGVRENPALKAYNTSIQRYSLLFKQITDLLPKAEPKPVADPLLDFIKQE